MYWNLEWSEKAEHQLARLEKQVLERIQLYMLRVSTLQSPTAHAESTFKIQCSKRLSIVTPRGKE